MTIPLSLGIVKCFSKVCDDKTSNLFSGFQIQIVEINSRSLNAIELPFKLASMICIIFLVFGALVCAISVFSSIFRSFSCQYLDYDWQLSLLASSIILNAIAISSYCFITVSFLNGGRFLDGVWLVLLSTIIAIFCALLSLTLDEFFGDNNEETVRFKHNSVGYSAI